jgi:NAD dependent epimerase/dehydratase family enzyme
MRELRRAMRVPLGLPAPAWATRLGAPLLMRTDHELALHGRYLVSRRLREEGFEFRYPCLPAALAELCSKSRVAHERGAELGAQPALHAANRS